MSPSLAGCVGGSASASSAVASSAEPGGCVGGAPGVRAVPRSTCEGIPKDRKGTPKGKGESKDKEAPQFPGVKYNVALINHGRKRGRHGDLYIADLYNLPVTIILACEMDHHTHTEKLHITDRSPPPSPAIATARLQR